MAFKVQFENGKTATFQNKPTDADIDEVAASFGQEQPTTTIAPSTQEKKPIGGIPGLAVGAAKGLTQTVQGLGQLGLKGAEKIAGRQPGAFGSDETFFEDKTALEAKTTSQKIGKFAEGVAEFAIPGTAVAKATKGTGLLRGLASRSATAGGVASAQAGDIGQEAIVAGVTEAALPVVGRVIKPAFKMIDRLFKGLSSGLSGASGESLETILSNPSKAAEFTRQLQKTTNANILETNARTIVNGISKVRQNAREAFGKGLAALRLEDINPATFRSSVQKFLTEAGSSVKGNIRTLKNVEFEDQKNLQKASNLIEEFSTVKLDGLSLRRLLDKIDNSRFRIARSDERLSFNAFLNDMSKAVKEAVSDSTNKLDEINAAFSKDMGLVEAVESILGKVKFKSAKEVLNASKKLEQLFSQKGISSEVVDEFLKRVGIDSAEFRTSEAVRQISNKTTSANAKGLSLGEIIQSVTSAVLTPKAVRDIAIFTGLSRKAAKEVFEKIAPAARGTLLQILTNRE